MNTLNLLVAGLLFVMPLATPAESAATSEPVQKKAMQLVDLVKPHESQALAVRFMTVISPIPLPPGVADCTVARATPAIKEYIAAIYSKNISESDLSIAVDFFESKDGRRMVELRLQHERDLYESATQGKTITNEQPEYPLQIRKALERFGATAVGSELLGKDELIWRQPFSKAISDLRDSAMAVCIEQLSAHRAGS
jgi:hypothetical protein